MELQTSQQQLEVTADADEDDAVEAGAFLRIQENDQTETDAPELQTLGQEPGAHEEQDIE